MRTVNVRINASGLGIIIVWPYACDRHHRGSRRGHAGWRRDLPKQLLELDGQSMLARSVAASRSSPRCFRDRRGAARRVDGAGSDTGRRDGPSRENRGRRRAPAGLGRKRVRRGKCGDVGHRARAQRGTAIRVGRGDLARDDAAHAHGAAIVAVPATDTVKNGLAPGGTVMPKRCRASRSFSPRRRRRFGVTCCEMPWRLDGRALRPPMRAALAERAGHPVRIVEGDPANMKITTASDLAGARANARGIRLAATPARVGYGYDLHRLVEGRPLVLGGVVVPSTVGALGYSDAERRSAMRPRTRFSGRASLGDIGRGSFRTPIRNGRTRASTSCARLRPAFERPGLAQSSTSTWS